MQQIRQKPTDQTLIKHQFSHFEIFQFLLGNLTRVELKNRGYEICGSVSITVVQSHWCADSHSMLKIYITQSTNLEKQLGLRLIHKYIILLWNWGFPIGCFRQSSPIGCRSMEVFDDKMDLKMIELKPGFRLYFAVWLIFLDMGAENRFKDVIGILTLKSA